MKFLHFSLGTNWRSVSTNPIMEICFLGKIEREMNQSAMRRFTFTATRTLHYPKFPASINDIMLTR